MQLEHFIVPSLLYSVFPQLFVREQFTQGIFLRPKAQQLFLNYLKSHLLQNYSQILHFHPLLISNVHSKTLIWYISLLSHPIFHTTPASYQYQRLHQIGPEWRVRQQMELQTQKTTLAFKCIYNFPS